MIKKIKDYTNEELIDTFLNFWDENDAIEALFELHNRKHSKTEEFFKIVFERGEFDEFDRGLTISWWYSFNENNAIDFIKNHYKGWHYRSFKSLLSDLWTESNEENPSAKKKELIKLIKKHLKTLKKEEITEIQDDYDAFMKAYKKF